MTNIVILLVALSLAGYLAFSRRLARSEFWKATSTPLASIMGSGFLVSAPLMAGVAGYYALFAIGALLIFAYGVGAAIRFNIANFEPIENEQGTPQTIAVVSRVVLAGAYFISVTYYLQLLAAFSLSGIGIENALFEHVITTALLVTIGGIGMWRGLDMLENLEKYTIALNLGMIGALLAALMIYNAQMWGSGDWKLPDVTARLDFHGLRVLLGLLIVVQGFETSRYLGAEHSADLRIRTMRWSQIISGLIYVAFIALATVLFRSNMDADVTAIIKMTRPVALLLPALLSIAAVGSQFSAAVADEEAAGGLIEDITHRKISIRAAYVIILTVTIFLTWATDVNQIIAYASRAFALFYMLQCVIALLVAGRKKELSARLPRLVLFALLSLLCLAVFLLGLPAE
ncbi:hypothetical protein [Blastopirellula marina]|uniref:Uncharacterized protein n=1 Tax=Blastopirellula marina DSM 3645 TaxID=314230 RepID=A3ZRI3_9BACT|nr:hypothetical protein [Blastopirellula marina]EAQ80752.1 hypothetical protein DSM3645_12066 [Blastopirellula marina DSM 3645]